MVKGELFHLPILQLDLQLPTAQPSTIIGGSPEHDMGGTRYDNFEAATQRPELGQNAAEEDSLVAIEQRLNDFFDKEEIYVMDVSDARPTLNGTSEGPLRFHGLHQPAARHLPKEKNKFENCGSGNDSKMTNKNATEKKLLGTPASLSLNLAGSSLLASRRNFKSLHKVQIN